METGHPPKSTAEPMPMVITPRIVPSRPRGRDRNRQPPRPQVRPKKAGMGPQEPTLLGADDQQGANHPNHRDAIGEEADLFAADIVLQFAGLNAWYPQHL